MDASQCDFGDNLMQDEKSDAYPSKSLTLSEQNNAHIEK